MRRARYCQGAGQNLGGLEKTKRGEKKGNQHEPEHRLFINSRTQVADQGSQPRPRRRRRCRHGKNCGGMLVEKRETQVDQPADAHEGDRQHAAFQHHAHQDRGGKPPVARAGHLPAQENHNQDQGREPLVGETDNSHCMAHPCIGAGPDGSRRASCPPENAQFVCQHEGATKLKDGNGRRVTAQ